MGGRSSTPTHEPVMDHHQNYPGPDMNVLFRDLPKLGQVADDMHRMTDYIMDLRNMTFAMLCFSLVVGIIYFIIKMVHRRSDSSFRKQAMERRIEAMNERSFPRHIHYSGYQGFCEPWPEPRPKTATSIDMEKAQLNTSGPNDTGDNLTETLTRPIETRGLPNGLGHKV